MSSTPSPTVFLYGTLMRGQCLSGALSGQQYLGDAITEADYRMYRVDDFPGLVEVAEGQGVQICGELWAVDLGTLDRLDAIECVDQGMYERRPIRLAENSDASIEDIIAEAWFYVPSVAGLEECGNDWRLA